MNMKRPDQIDIVIPVYTAEVPECLLKCVDSICRNTKNFNLILSGSNERQSVNVNRGLDRIKGDYAVIMDWDVEVTPRWLETLFSQFDESVGIVGPSMGGDYTGIQITQPTVS